jgi:hypothetical protein
MKSKLTPPQHGFSRRGFFGRIALGLPLLLPFNRGQSAALTANSNNDAYFKEPSRIQDHWEELAEWHAHEREPIWEGEDSHAELLIEAIRRGEILYGTYDRYGADQVYRRITPLLLYRIYPWPKERILHDAFNGQESTYIENKTLYLQAWDHDKKAQRTFHADAFAVCPTAPWMHPYHNDMSPFRWNDLMERTALHLRENGVQPVA